ncbi:MAG: bifunctional tRNA (5-methylaminomethyl-2-thiouridine)(34)-methyltransferase MnmD/FAD-dependent 5-carboxymethylaminomethyl-2-thiouridine(34) oxidoreductase MnmC [Gammaproteobacteria bacterium]|nr:bifunctional tRNA (5-methylaminomethyl-2-thiouridine)(34)-methyltransferase MnmD/FAD-dependent 5-carboxymethylaminomethyl-2-thiouridine(34) oxidoreductase MnmC [Gammaproteobacteria bacterium]
MKQAKIEWQQGQPVSSVFDDVYFSREGGIAETEYVFLHNNGLPERWQGSEQFVIGETGFGTGLNFLTTVVHWLNSSSASAHLYYFSVEKFPLSKSDIQQALSVWPEFKPLLNEFISAYPPAVKGFHPLHLFNRRVTLVLMLGDVNEMLCQMKTQVDAWYLDGFAPGKNPDMWTDSVFEQIARLSHEHTRFSTFTAAGFVRRGLADQGFEVHKVKGFGQKRDMLAGEMRAIKNNSSQQPWFEVPVNTVAGKHVAIIGGGIAGITTAWLLANSGWQVDLYEKHAEPAMEASGNPLGVLLPRISLDDSADAEFYASAYFKAVNELDKFKTANSDFNWQSTGVVQLASSERIRKQIEKLNCAPELAQVVKPNQASEICGVKVDEDALFYPLAGCFTPAELCKKILQQAAGKIVLHSNTQVGQIEKSASHWLLKDGANQLLGEADVLVLANAAAVKAFQQTSWLALQPVRGQLSLLPVNAKSNNIKSAICYEGYITPAINGYHVCGATFEPGSLSTELLQSDHAKNLADVNDWLADIFELDSYKLQGRAAIRAVTPDRMPLVGPVADIKFYNKQYHDLQKGKAATKYPEAQCLDGLYVNVGHGARGLTSCFLAAELLASQINNEPQCVSNRVQYALNPARFIIRALKKGQFVNNENNVTGITDLPCHQCTGCM